MSYKICSFINVLKFKSTMLVIRGCKYIMHIKYKFGTNLNKTEGHSGNGVFSIPDVMVL
jgi:hypothetical protein